MTFAKIIILNIAFHYAMFVILINHNIILKQFFTFYLCICIIHLLVKKHTYAIHVKAGFIYIVIRHPTVYARQISFHNKRYTILQSDGFLLTCGMWSRQRIDALLVCNET